MKMGGKQGGGGLRKGHKRERMNTSVEERTMKLSSYKLLITDYMLIFDKEISISLYKTLQTV